MNWPQRRSSIIRARYEVAILARGVGKTEGIIAPRMAHNAYALPRSVGGMVTPSFKKLFTELVPSIYSGLDALGYEENRHYFIGKRGPESWDRPHKRMKDWSHAMHWSCGSALAFISQDRAGMGNGISTDYYIVDEGKLINGQRFQDSSRQAMRGNRQHFDGQPEFQSILIVSDRPTTKAGKWFMQYRERMDPEVIEFIFQGAYRQQQLRDAINSGSLSERTVQDYLYEIDALERELNELRCEAVYFHEASALDNIDVIGWENFLEMERSMDPRLFKTSMLNEDFDFVEGAWYSDLDDERHCYTPSYTSFTVERGYDRDRITSKDSRHDAEIIPSLPIDIALDYGGRINCLVVGQMFGDLYRVDNAFHGLHPMTTSDVVKLFTRYYAQHKNKTVFYYYDHTALDRHGASGLSYYDSVFNTLREEGWTVVAVDIGHTPAPAQRYEQWSGLLRAQQAPLMFNPDNCKDLLTAMRLVAIKEGPKGIEKDKRPERGSLEEQVHAPHYTDAVDTLVWGRFQVTGMMGSVPVPSLFI